MNSPSAFAMPEALPELRSGHLEVRLAQSQAEIEASQALRYQVFYEECGAHPSDQVASLKRDFDGVDSFCDHLLVIDHSRGPNAIVGTYRFMRREAASRYGTYYTAAEFEIDKLISQPGEVMELGRSCVHKDYRTRPVMQLLWRGIGAYIITHNVALCFGCASFRGTQIEKYREAMAYLYHYHLAPEDFRARPLPSLYQEMNTIPKENVDKKKAMHQLPPLIKGYLRLGGFVGDGAIVDPQFNTVDVCIIVKRELMTERYSNRYTTDLEIA
ncbi:GNAT family N-acetyltransferase [Candidatus Bealeia paramacronuclearis]